jgi:manganese transport protein
MLGVVALIYIGELFVSHPDPMAVFTGTAVPRFAGPQSLLLGAGILGATVMPHVIYLHSSLSEDEDGGAQRLSARSLYHASCWDVGLAMTLAAFVNLAMLAMAAAVLHGSGAAPVDGLEGAYRTLQPVLGHAAVAVFGGSLIIAGVSSTVVGTMAGQTVMQDFVHFKISLWVRRAVTMAPSFVVIAIGLDTTKVLVFSQVVLSFGIALALIPLLLLTGSRKTMGDLVNHRITTLIGWGCVVVVVALNSFVLSTSVFGVKF